MPRTKSELTVKELRARAKVAYAGGKGNQALKGYHKMKKEALENALGISKEARAGSGATKKSKTAKPSLTAKRYESAKQSHAIAHALKKKMGLDDKSTGKIHEQLRNGIKKAVDKLRRSKPNASDQETRAVALGAVRSTISLLKADQKQSQSSASKPRNTQSQSQATKSKEKSKDSSTSKKEQKLSSTKADTLKEKLSKSAETKSESKQSSTSSSSAKRSQSSIADRLGLRNPATTERASKDKNKDLKPKKEKTTARTSIPESDNKFLPKAHKEILDSVNKALDDIRSLRNGNKSEVGVHSSFVGGAEDRVHHLADAVKKTIEQKKEFGSNDEHQIALLDQGIEKLGGNFSPEKIKRISQVQNIPVDTLNRVEKFGEAGRKLVNLTYEHLMSDTAKEKWTRELYENNRGFEGYENEEKKSPEHAAIFGDLKKRAIKLVKEKKLPDYDGILE